MSFKCLYSDLCQDVFESEEFQNKLYVGTLRVVVNINNIKSEKDDITKEDLSLFTRELFSIPKNDHELSINRALQQDLTKNYLLQIFVDRGERLSAKDLNGYADPYCLIAIVSKTDMVKLNKGKYNTKRTKTVKSSLNPKWKESFEIILTKDEIEKCFLQIQVWDSDQDMKDVKDLKKSYLKDDFMGYISIRLSESSSGCIEKYFKLKSSHILQRVSGQVKVKLNLTPVQLTTNEKESYSPDLLYAGLLQKALQNAEEISKDESDDCLSSTSKLLLDEFVQQFRISKPLLAMIRWEAYRYHHAKNASVDVFFLEKLLDDVNKCHDQKNDPSQNFSMDMLSNSIALFIRKECDKLVEHFEAVALQQVQNNSLVMKSLDLIKRMFSMEIFQLVLNVDPEIVVYIRKNLTAALEKGASNHYIKSFTKCQKEFSNDTINDESSEQVQLPDISVDGLVSLVEMLHEDLCSAKIIYQSSLSEDFGVDFESCVSCVLQKHIEHDANDRMKKYHENIFKKQDCEGVKKQVSALFRFYRALRKICFLNFFEKFAEDRNLDEDHKTPDSDSYSSNIDKHYREWFFPVLLRWVEMCQTENKKVIQKAIELDSGKRVSETAKHSSSSVDTIQSLCGVVDTWKALEWSQPFDAYIISLCITRDVTEAVEFYVDTLYKFMKAAGFFDNEGQFDVTEKLCLALNNVQYAAFYLGKLSKIMEFQKLSCAVGNCPEGPTTNEALSSLEKIVKDSLGEIDKKVWQILIEVGKHLEPDIQTFLKTFSDELQEKNTDRTSSQVNGGQEFDKLKNLADQASRGLMKYLESNVKMLFSNLCQESFKIVLEVLWKICTSSLQGIAFTKLTIQSPAFSYQCSFLLDLLLEFFYAEGTGLSDDLLKNFSVYQSLRLTLSLRSATTQELITKYYRKMYEKQILVSNKLLFGILDVYAWYDNANETVNFEIIRARNLKPLDLNGFSDPFVQIRFVPSMLFPESRVFETKVQKKTLNPYWQETFSFKLDKAFVDLTNAFLLFTVLDYDRIGKNELEGEAVFPLEKLERKGKNDPQTYELIELPLLAFSDLSIFSKNGTNQEKRFSDNLGNIEEQYQNYSTSLEWITNVDGSNPKLELFSELTLLQLLKTRSDIDKDAAKFYKERRSQNLK